MQHSDKESVPFVSTATRVKAALELENLKSIQATHDINKEFAAEKNRLVADCNRRGALMGGEFIKKVTQLEVKRARRLIESGIELRQETLVSTPDVGSEEEYARLLENLYRIADMTISSAAREIKKYQQRVADRTNDDEPSGREEAEIRRLRDYAKGKVDVLRKERELASMVFTRSVRVTLVRGGGSAAEKRTLNVQMGGDLNQKALFKADVDIKRGDEIHCPEVFDEPRVAVRVVTETFADGSLGWYAVAMQPLSEYQERQRLMEKPFSVQQNFHGSVGKVAGRDIIENNVTSVTLLSVLGKAVEEAEDIPDEEKASILQQVRTLAENPYVSGIATGAILEGVKAMFT